MIDLRALGALDLRQRDGPELHSVLAQPKRTALLAYLALARPHGFHRRDSLIALFWPENDSEHGRASLRQAVFHLRRSLGEETILSRGDEDIGLGDGVLSCDAVQFDAALDAGELERALGLYAGDLLPGFFVDEAPDFERWLEGERTRLRERAVRACWSLAQAAERAGDTAAAAEWGRRALAIAPADDTQIMRLMQLLARAGDRSGALAAFDAHARRLRTELEVEPTEATKALAEEIRKAEPLTPAELAKPLRVEVEEEPEPGAAKSPATTPTAPPRARESATGPAAPSPTPSTTISAPAKESPWRRQLGRPWLLPVGAALGVVLVGVVLAVRPRSSPSVSTGRIVDKASIAVLPFLDLSPKRDQDYFSDGLTEELLNVLAQVPALRVVARTSCFAFKGKQVEIDSIGRALHVAQVLEGSVRTDGLHVRITAQLIDSRTSYHIWSAAYDRDLKDIFALQREISAAIAQQLRLKLGAPAAPPAPGAATSDPEAHTLVLRAIQLRRQGTPERLQQAEVLLQNALRRDPGYARAHAELASIYQYQAYRRFAAPEERYPLAQAEARRALTLDPRNGYAHVVLGWIAANHDWDFDAAQEHYRLALESIPSEAGIHGLRALLLVRLHRPEEALAEAERAAALDPLSPNILNILAAIHLYTGRSQQAIDAFKAAIALDSLRPYSFANLATVYASVGDTAQARQTLLVALRLAPDDDFAQAAAAYVYARAGQRALGSRYLRLLEGKPDASPYLAAGAYLALGDRERALGLLEKSIRGRDDFAADAAVDPTFNALHGDPRFQRILAEGGLK